MLTGTETVYEQQEQWEAYTSVTLDTQGDMTIFNPVNYIHGSTAAF